MARRKQLFPNLTAAEAHAALRWFHATGRITAKEIADALRKREDLAAEVRTMLEALGGDGVLSLTGPAAIERHAPANRRRRKVSAKAQAAWRTQGEYLGAVRRLSKVDRLKVKAIRKKSGVRAAITAAKRLGR